MKNNEILWENLSVLVNAFMLAAICVGILSPIFGSAELFISAIVLLLLASLIDTIQANVNPERYYRGDF